MKPTRIAAILLVMVLAVVAVFNCGKISSFFKNLFGPREKIEVVRHFPFSAEGSLREWEEKIFKGKVLYRIDKENHQSFVMGSSDGTASALYYKVKLNMRKRPVISWKWNAQKFPTKDGPEDITSAKQDDFAARVYVIFPSLLFTNSKAIEYIWSEDLPVGTISPSPYSKNLQLIVVESGKNDGGKWVSERRDIYEDYLKAFGRKPKLNIGAIAFMTDADSTGTSAESFYDEIDIGYKPGGAE